MVVFYSTVDKLIAKLGIENFNLIRYTVTGRISLLEMAPSSDACMKALLIAVLLGAAVTILSGQIFRQRDI